MNAPQRLSQESDGSVRYLEAFEAQYQEPETPRFGYRWIRFRFLVWLFRDGSSRVPAILAPQGDEIIVAHKSRLAQHFFKILKLD